MNDHRLTFLDPHEDANLWDHGLDSPTFKDVIKDNIGNYLYSLEK